MTGLNVLEFIYWPCCLLEESDSGNPLETMPLRVYGAVTMSYETKSNVTVLGNIQDYRFSQYGRVIHNHLLLFCFHNIPVNLNWFYASTYTCMCVML